MDTPVKVAIKGQVAWVTIDYPPVNATSQAVRAGLIDAVSRVQGCKLAVLNCAGKTFIAGGDISEFDAPPMLPHLPEVVDAIEQSTTPFVAHLYGTVLGGGFEIAMACAYRVAKPGTRFGLPEVNIGLIPGAGGTLRGPRLLGWEMAVEMACLGQMKSAKALLAVGGIDAITDDFEVEALSLAPVTPVSKRTLAPPTDAEIATFEARVAQAARGRQAPAQNLKALLSATAPYADAQPMERAVHLELRGSPESKALRHVFFAERTAAKPARLKGITPKALSSITIVGGGLMGAGIAAACLNGGYAVTVIERDQEAAEAARARINGLLQGAVDRGKISELQHAVRMAVFDVASDYAAARSTDLAIEAVFEDLDAKRAVFRSLADVVAPDTILATNTSYLNPNDIFDGIPYPERCLGLHFFSPAHIMKLMEVVQASDTSDEALATGFALARHLRKTPALAGICDGFIGNRMLSAYRRAAEYIIADGALPHEVDAAMRAFGMAMGPFETQDQSGLQIAEANRRRQDATRDPRERYIPISDQLCAQGRFGRQSKAGWYDYSSGKAEPDKAVEALILDYAKGAGIARRPFSADEIQAQLLAAMVNEGAALVDEGIAESDAVVDVVKTSGYGFPRWRGGPMHWADQAGVGLVRSALDALDAASPGSWSRAPRFHDE